MSYKVAIAISAIPLAIYLWARHDEAVHHAAVEEYAHPNAQPEPERERRVLEPHPSQPAFPVMPGSPGYIQPPRKSPRAQKTVHIGDEAIPITLRVDSTPAPDAYEAEHLKAFGHANRCAQQQGLPTSDSEMREAERSYRLGMITKGNRGFNGELISQEQIDKTVEAIWKMYQECRDSSAQELRAALTQLSHDEGYQARYAYAKAIRDDNPVAARTIYEQLWKEQGQIQVLGALGLWGGSLPHEIAYYAAQIAVMERSNDEVHNELTARYRKELDAIQTRVHPHEFSEASQQAAQILRSPRCCLYP